MKTGMPYARAGQTIGLLGGSFDPPHRGHAHITREALKRFGLDRVWWLVSPGNPLKPRGPAPMGDRLAAARAVMRHPRVTVTDIEADLGTRATADTLAALQMVYPGVGFAWLMGADNLTQFHRWQDWRQIMGRVPVGVLARPGQRISARMSPVARIYSKYRIGAAESHGLARAMPPAWCFINVAMVDLSSTALRDAGGWSPGQGGQGGPRPGPDLTPA